MVENIQLSSPYQHSINSQMHYIYTKQNPFMHVSYSMKPRRHCNFIDHLTKAALVVQMNLSWERGEGNGQVGAKTNESKLFVSDLPAWAEHEQGH